MQRTIAPRCLAREVAGAPRPEFRYVGAPQPESRVVAAFFMIWPDSAQAPAKLLLITRALLGFADGIVSVALTARYSFALSPPE